MQRRRRVIHREADKIFAIFRLTVNAADGLPGKEAAHGKPA